MLYRAVTYIVTTTVSAVLAMLSYTVYALDLIKSTTALKIQHIAEITMAYIVFVLLLIVSIIMMTQCTGKKYALDYVPEVSASDTVNYNVIDQGCVISLNLLSSASNNDRRSLDSNRWNAALP